jgi:RNA polymerase sigma-70 factor, ECF subfamily
MQSESRAIDLVSRAQRGERAAFDRLVDLYRPRIEALVDARLGAHLRGEIETDDVFQETLLKAFESIERFSWEGEDSFMRWVGTIAENVIRGAARRAERRQNLPPPASAHDDGNLTQSRVLRRDERFQRFQAAFDALDPDARKVIYLARIRGLPMSEVARRIGRTTNATSILLYRALKKLREEFGDTESLRLPFRNLEE